MIGIDPCGVIFGVSRFPYERSARFKVGAPVSTIYWQKAPPGAKVYDKPNIFFPLVFTKQDPHPDDVGEFTSSSWRRIAWGPPPAVDGQTPHGSEDDFLGLTVYTGPIPWSDVAPCRVPPAVELLVFPGYTRDHFALLMRRPAPVDAIAFVAAYKNHFGQNAVALDIVYTDKRGQNVIAFKVGKPASAQNDTLAFVAKSDKVGTLTDAIAFVLESSAHAKTAAFAFATKANFINPKDTLAFAANYTLGALGRNVLAFDAIAEPPTVLHGGNILAFGCSGQGGTGAGQDIALNALAGPLASGNLNMAFTAILGSGNVHITDDNTDCDRHKIILRINGSNFSGPASTNLFTIKDSAGVILPSRCVEVDAFGTSVTVILTNPPGANLGAVYASCVNNNGDTAGFHQVANFVNKTILWTDTFTDADATALSAHIADVPGNNPSYTQVSAGAIIQGNGLAMDPAASAGTCTFNTNLDGIGYCDYTFNVAGQDVFSLWVDNGFATMPTAQVRAHNATTLRLTMGSTVIDTPAVTGHTYKYVYEILNFRAAVACAGVADMETGSNPLIGMNWWIQISGSAGGSASPAVDDLNVVQN